MKYLCNFALDMFIFTSALYATTFIFSKFLDLIFKYIWSKSK